jgi:HK97 family phage major capsid protein/HK97 family phage prohead protease
MDRAYSLLEIKSIDDDLRVIRGIASTPTTDHMGDIVEPMGAKFKLPIPLLWQHDKSHPIGHVTHATVTPQGIEIEAQIAKNVTPRIDEAWALIKGGLVRGLSVGFKTQGDKVERLKTGGLRIKEWLWHELSAVTIPANAEASISLIKSLDEEQQRATSGAALVTSPSVQGSAAATRSRVPLLLSPRGQTVKTISEQVKDLEAARAAKTNQANEVMQKSIAEGRATEADEASQADELLEEVKRLDGDIARLKTLEAISVAKAVPVTADAGKAVDVRGGVLSVKAAELPKGIEFARYAMCLAKAQGNARDALDIAKSQYPDQARVLNVLEAQKSMGSRGMSEMMEKAAVLAGTTVGTTWAAPLVQYQQFAGDFVEFLRPQTIIGKFGQNGVPSLRQVPFNVTIPAQTSGGDAYWVGEGAPKPLTSFDFSSSNLRFTKLASIAVLTEELIRFSSPSAEALVRDSLAAAVIQRMDIDFINPAKAAVSNVSPASITNGATTSVSAGGTEANVRTDITTLFGTYIAANMTPATGVWIMSSRTALQLSMMVN